MDVRQDQIQREFLAHKLIAGSATQEERDNALAAIMLSMWTMDDLRKAFDQWHATACANCPAKAKAEAEAAAEEARARDSTGWKDIALMLLKYGGWLILIIAGLLKLNLPQ